MSRVVTYRLAYLPLECTLCAACVERDDHDLGSLGPVQHGEHEGRCQGIRHVSGRERCGVNGNWAILGKRDGADHWSECSPARYATRAIAEHQARLLRELDLSLGHALETMVEELAP